MIVKLCRRFVSSSSLHVPLLHALLTLGRGVAEVPHPEQRGLVAGHRLEVPQSSPLLPLLALLLLLDGYRVFHHGVLQLYRVIHHIVSLATAVTAKIADTGTAEEGIDRFGSQEELGWVDIKLGGQWTLRHAVTSQQNINTLHSVHTQHQSTGSTRGWQLGAQLRGSFLSAILRDM